MTRVLLLAFLVLAQTSETPPDPTEDAPQTLALKGADLQLLSTVREISKQVQERFLWWYGKNVLTCRVIIYNVA